ncbi:MAG: hypothetical protein ABSE40_00690 [Candidatus Sulfotelmatobacter sp.]
MPTPDDERFEAYLRQFRPQVPDPLPTEGLGHAPRHRFVLRAWLAAAAAVLVIGAIGLQIRSGRVTAPKTTGDAASAGQFVPLQPLTMRSANALLATAPSYKAVVDTLAFPTQAPPLTADKQSAIALLGKERIKL